MKVRFWGVRGSLPSPLTPSQYRSRIAAIIQRITEEDIGSQRSRELFLSKLPGYLKSVTGGNTTCVELSAESGGSIIFDAGSGIRELSRELVSSGCVKGTFHIFFTHFHWDHIQGLPFFTPYLFKDDCVFHFYHADGGIRENLEYQMNTRFFPVPFPSNEKRIHFHKIPESGVNLGDLHIAYRHMKHPGGSIAYKVKEKNRSFIFATDTELAESDFEKTDDNDAFFKDADLMVLDSQYTLDEALDKTDWGHTSYSLAVDFALSWDMKKLGLFHHNPNYSDKKLHSVENAAIEYCTRSSGSRLTVFSAFEGMEVVI